LKGRADAAKLAAIQGKVREITARFRFLIKEVPEMKKPREAGFFVGRIRG